MVKQVFFEAVGKAHEYILENYCRIIKNYNIPEEKMGEHPFVCWCESDLRTLMVYHLLNKLKGQVFIHTEAVLKKADKFKYDGLVQRRLWLDTVEEILRYKKRKRLAGDIDIAITSASTDTIPYSVERYGRNVVDEVKEAYSVLKIMKQEKLSKRNSNGY